MKVFVIEKHRDGEWVPICFWCDTDVRRVLMFCESDIRIRRVKSVAEAVLISSPDNHHLNMLPAFAERGANKYEWVA